MSVPARSATSRLFARWQFKSWAVLLPTVVILGIVVYGFIGWTIGISFTSSRFAANFDFVGWQQYAKLWRTDRWLVAVNNLWVFSLLFIGLSIVVGLLLAIFLDQKVRMENFIRSIYLYPMAISFIVTGVSWKWILNPSLGLEKFVHDLGFTSFSFDWLINPEKSIYTLVIAAFWQSSGFIMAIFLSGLRGVDAELFKAARLEGASLPRVYWSIVLPTLRPVFFSAVVILLYQALRSFDLVVALTNGGPGFSSDLPTTFMYQYTFGRGQLAQGAASAVMITMTVVAIITPYLYSEIRNERNNAR
ncbi:sugar ABC transporter permease [Pseudomonas sp. Z1-12]|uniref:carbohydrate ABC transporter permease n=1 Tax=unclassified Pseudomonas TaxID=196821 RepID=UPI0038068E04